MSCLKRIFALFMSLILIIFTLPSCTISEQDSSEQLRYYSCDEYEPLLAVIEEYNNYCSKNNKKSEEIEIVKFDSEDEMNTKLSTEIMAGSGPDIISLGQKLPFEKLADNGAFADLNELFANDTSDDKIDMNDYNETVMNCGVYNGKRYFLPLFYSPDIVIVRQETLDKFKISHDFDFTYNSLSSELSYYLENMTDTQFYWWGYTGSQFFRLFINSYVDYFNKESYLDSEEFKSNFDTVSRIVKNDNDYDSSDNVYYVGISDYNGIFYSWQQGTVSALSSHICHEKLNGNHPIIMPNARRDNKTVSAYAECALAINANTEHKDKALNFIKYVLSEDVQTYWCNAEWKTFLASMPVNKKAFDSEVEDAYKYYKYSIEMEGVSNEEISELLAKSVDECVKAIESINECSIYNYYSLSQNYYNSTVIGEIVDDYLNGKITKEKFLRQLKSTTKIYLTE